MTRRVLVAEPLGEEGLAEIAAAPGIEVVRPAGPGELREAIGDAHALIVRSATRVDAELLAAAGRLEVVVRAGTGTDNIDLDAATARGIVVMNTPGGNTNAAVEHTFALLLALARRVPAASRSLQEGRWERERFVGFELAGRTLGVVGLGRIGAGVAERARAFRMEILGHDPFISREAAQSRGIPLVPLAELLERSDIVTLHVPLSDETRHLLDAAALARMKPGAHLVNCARGGLVDEPALVEALDAGRLAGAALDAFEAEPRPDPRLVGRPRVVATPHLGASTDEAKANVGIQAARQALGVLLGTSFENAINVPFRDPALLSRLQPVLGLCERLAAFQIQLQPGGVREVRLEIAGEVEDTTPLRVAYLRGLLGRMLGTAVNWVNAPFLAQQRGIRVTESRPAGRGPDLLVTATLVTDSGSTSASGTAAGAEARLVEIEGFRIDAIPEGHLLVCRSIDRPGVIGRLGTLLGNHGLNISEFRLGRSGPGGEAMSLITLDEPPPRAVLDELRSLPEVRALHAVTL